MQSTTGFITRSVLPVLFVLTAMAKTPGSFADSINSPSEMPAYISSVVYRFVENEETPPQNFTDNLGETEHAAPQTRFFRAERNLVSRTRSNFVTENDHLSVTLSTPGRAVNNVLSLAGTVLQTPLNSSATKVLQTLTLVAAREANVDFSYTAQINRNSRFDSMISCRLHNTDASKLDVVARIQYRIDF